MKSIAIAALPALVLISACAAAPQANTSRTVAAEEEYVTGSNLPRRSKAGTDRTERVTRDDLDRGQPSAMDNPLDPKKK